MLAAVFSGLVITHSPLLRLPYFWDEAGYYIPAAHDLFTTGALIPQSTLTNAHPPLLMIYLASAWKIFGYAPAVTRCAMLLVAAITLVAVYAIAERVSSRSVAIAAVICTALYAVFFSQSAMAHLDMAAACFILWGVYFYLGDQRKAALVMFALAGLSKETAVLAPLALFGLELLVNVFSKGGNVIGVTAGFRRREWPESLVLLLSLVPLAGWF